MTNKEFLNKVSHSQDDFLQSFIDILEENEASFCVIGGLAVNAYAEPLVSLDLDVIIVSEGQKGLVEKLARIYKIETFPNSINLSKQGSDLRIQIQTDTRYQDFLPRAKVGDVLGYQIPVACIEDVIQGKIWAASDDSRRPSKRQKDYADIMRLIEAKGELKDLLPEKLKEKLYS